MPPTDAPTWWTDVQQDRDDLRGRPAPESWLEEEIDFAPRKRFPRREQPQDLHGVFVHAQSAPVGAPRAHRPARVASSATGTATEIVLERLPEAGTAEIVLEREDATWRGWGDVEEPPATGTRRTVHITGRPEARPGRSTARAARRPRTAAERFGHRPDRIVFWAVVLGIFLILLAITSAGS